jgi:flagellar biosynthesis anti-sigma factor FlgM
VDKSRITEIRNQIASGQYQINAARVAEKIIGFEAGL